MFSKINPSRKNKTTNLERTKSRWKILTGVLVECTIKTVSEGHIVHTRPKADGNIQRMRKIADKKGK